MTSAWSCIRQGLLGLGCVGVTVGPAAAGEDPATANAPAKATTLSGLDVALPKQCLQPRNPPDPSIPSPKVVNTFPAQGTVVRPGLLVLRVSFDLPMTCEGFFLVAPGLAKPCADEPVQHLVLSYDRRTIRMACGVAKNTQYGIRMNYPPTFDVLPPGAEARLNFRSLAGWPGPLLELTFSTSSGPEVASLEEAEAEDPGGPSPLP